MLPTPKCFSDKRKCIHFLGVKQVDGTEESEILVCKAFPDGIPNDIAFGDDSHKEAKKGQKGDYVFEELKEE